MAKSRTTETLYMRACDLCFLTEVLETLDAYAEMEDQKSAAGAPAVIRALKANTSIDSEELCAHLYEQKLSKPIQTLTALLEPNLAELRNVTLDVTRVFEEMFFPPSKVLTALVHAVANGRFTEEMVWTAAQQMQAERARTPRRARGAKKRVTA